LLFRSTGDSSYFYLYRISYMWYSVLGFLITFMLGLLVSALSRAINGSRNANLDPNLFFPMIARRIRSRQRHDVEIADVYSNHEKKYSFDSGLCENGKQSTKL
jgi:hypothetical protein